MTIEIRDAALDASSKNAAATARVKMEARTIAASVARGSEGS